MNPTIRGRLDAVLSNGVAALARSGWGQAQVALLALVMAACAGGGRPAALPAAAGDDAGALEVQRGWWRAYAVADTAYLQAHTAPDLRLTVSSGTTYDRAGMLAAIGAHVNGSRLVMEWSDESVRLASPSVAIATTRVTETDGPVSAVYRYLTTMERTADGWRVLAAQSTRELAFTPRVSAAQAGPLADYAGAYRTPRGATLRVEVRDSALALIEPSGAQIPIEPIGPGLFEFRTLSPSNGVVRIAFARDTAGRVTSMTRILNGVANVFPRIP
jgi:hypothetical protein